MYGREIAMMYVGLRLWDSIWTLSPKARANVQRWQAKRSAKRPSRLQASSTPAGSNLTFEVDCPAGKSVTVSSNGVTVTISAQ